MGIAIEVSYFNTFRLKRLAHEFRFVPVPDPSQDWYLEESRIRGGYNNTSVDFGKKAFVVNPNVKQARRSNSIIYSGIYNSRTGINNTNQFPVGEDITRSVDPVGGSIQKLHAEDTNLLIFQEKKVNKALIDKDAVYSAEGSALTTSARLVIGQIIAYGGNWGIGTNPESFAVYGYRKYFVDPNQNAVLRLSRDGITDISKNGMSDFFRDKLGDTDSRSKIVGGWDLYNKQYVLSIQPEGHKESYNTLSFDENVLGWTSFYSYNPSSVVSGKGKTYTSNDGKWYEHYSDNVDRASFYGNEGTSKLVFILNPSPTVVKNFNTVSYEGSNGWEITSIVSDDTGLDFVNGVYSNHIDTASRIWSYDEGAYTENNISYHAGFDRKQNSYTAAIKNSSPPMADEVLFGTELSTPSGEDFWSSQVTGMKAYYATVTIQPDVTTNTGGPKELFSVGSSFTI